MKGDTVWDFPQLSSQPFPAVNQIYGLSTRVKSQPQGSTDANSGWAKQIAIMVSLIHGLTRIQEWKWK